MAQIQLNQTGSKTKFTHSLKIDMTPMVDLGFLLITFFIFTSAISESKGLNLYMPKDGPNTNQPASKALTLFLKSNDQIEYYSGRWQDAVDGSKMSTTDYHQQYGIGKIIREKQRLLGSLKDELMILIKPTKESTYNNLIDVLDEMTINGIKKYAILDLSAEEKAFFKQ